jgi:hypothetical protein
VQGGGANDMFENSNGSVKEAMPNTEVVAKAKRKRFTALALLFDEHMFVGPQGFTPHKDSAQRKNGKGFKYFYLHVWKESYGDNISNVTFITDLGKNIRLHPMSDSLEYFKRGLLRKSPAS